MSKQIASPSPVPPNFLLIPLSACENGLNMIFNCSGVIPIPLSFTENLILAVSLF